MFHLNFSQVLHNVDIDKNAFPNFYQWHSALMKYSLEERVRYERDSQYLNNFNFRVHDRDFNAFCLICCFLQTLSHRHGKYSTEYQSSVFYPGSRQWKYRMKPFHKRLRLLEAFFDLPSLDFKWNLINNSPVSTIDFKWSIYLIIPQQYSCYNWNEYVIIREYFINSNSLQIFKFNLHFYLLICFRIIHCSQKSYYISLLSEFNRNRSWEQTNVCCIYISFINGNCKWLPPMNLSIFPTFSNNYTRFIVMMCGAADKQLLIWITSILFNAPCCQNMLSVELNDESFVPKISIELIFR